MLEPMMLELVKLVGCNLQEKQISQDAAKILAPMTWSKFFEYPDLVCT